jgi:sugar lactone lactonase YvrE
MGSDFTIRRLTELFVILHGRPCTSWRKGWHSDRAVIAAGTEATLFANGLTFDEAGNLYATESSSGDEGDTTLGAIWRITPDGATEKWMENTTLGGPPRFGTPNGANGISYNDGVLYVMVTQQTSVFTVPILADGSPGEITPFVVTENKFIRDGIALDVGGRVYSTDIVTNGVIRINPDGTIDSIASGTEAGFDQATTIAFGIGGTELTMYAVNLAGGGFEPNDGLGPALGAIDVDTSGRPLP